MNTIAPRWNSYPVRVRDSRASDDVAGHVALAGGRGREEDGGQGQLENNLHD